MVGEGGVIPNVPVGPDPIVGVDVETGEILGCNDVCAEELGYERGELVGRTDEVIYASEGGEPAEEIRRVVAGGERVRNRQMRMVRRGGEVFDASVSASLVGGEGERMRSSVRDITELKETQRELEERTRRLEQSNQELEQFAYLASHDLQEPLRMVASYTELLAKRYEDDLDDQAQKYIGYAVEGAERMKVLLNDLLQYSRVGRGGGEFERVELEDVVDVVEANLRVRIAEEGAEIERGDLPAVRGSESQLVNLFQNLVDNGLKFNDTGVPHIEIGAEREGDRVSVRVSDDGIGFDPEHADRIFQVFQRLNERGAYDGTGIGLAIVKKVVESHGGEVRVESGEGEGTTFIFDLEAA